MFFKKWKSWFARLILILAIAGGGLGAFSVSAISLDAADGWMNVGPAGFSAAGISDISLSLNGDTPYVAFSDDQSSFGVTVMKYNGSSWEAVGTPGFSGPGLSTYISLAFNGNVPYVAYRDGANGFKATVMKYNGSNWEPVGAPGISAWHAFYTNLTFSDGIPYIAFQDGANGFKATVMKYNGSNWEPVGTPGFSTGMADYISFAFNDGIPYVAFMDNHGSKGTVMNFNGSSWEVVGTRAFADGCWDLVFNADIPYVACNYYLAESRVMKYNGNSWEAVDIPDIADIAGGFMSLDFRDGTPIPYVAYNDEANGGKITVKKYNGSSWELVGMPGFSTGKTAQGYLSFVISGGTPYVAYADDENGNKATVMKYMDPETEIYVNRNATGANNGTSWDNAFTDLQSALSAASSGDEIWVAAGTYKPTTGTDRTVSFNLKNGVAIYGGFVGTETLLSQRDYEAHVTVLSGDIGVADDNSDNSYHVVVGSSTNASAILDGFTITHGNANTPDAGVAHLGGGMYNTNGSPTLTHLIFTDNSAVWGGGMANEDHSNPSLTDVTFSENTTQSETYIQTVGGGMFNTNSSPSLENVTFYNNSAAGGGGLFNATSSPTLVNVTFVGNTAEYGSGIFSRDANSHPILDHVTLHGNTATYSEITETYGGTVADWGGIVIKNSILWGNVGGNITISGFDLPVVSNSIIEGGYTGTGNLNVDPLLGPLQDNGGFTQTMALGAGSPAIDAANDDDCPEVDQRGVTRPQGSHCDIGAYEYVFSPTPTDTPTATATHTSTATATATVTPTATATVTRTPTMQPVAKPGIPVLLSPANGALVNSLQPVLDWKNSNPAAHHYQVQVSTNNGFTALVINENDVADSTFTPPTALAPGKLYYWRVRAFNVNGIVSGWSSVRMFKTPLAQPVLVLPTEGEFLLTDRPAFAWGAVPGASSYILQISRLENFSTLLVNATVNATEYSMTKDLPGGKTLYWRVRAKTPAVTGPWSTTSSFTTGNPPSVPVLSSPANGVLVRDYSPRFNWKDSTVPSGTTLKHYELQVDEDKGFTSPMIEYISVGSEFTPDSDFASNTKYYWRVRAVNMINDNDHISGWSPIWSFRTVIAAPGSLTMIPNAENSQQPSFEWAAATGTGTITGYTIQVSTRADFSTFLVNSTTKMPAYSMLKDLPAGKTIYWRVRVNGANGPSPWSAEEFDT